MQERMKIGHTVYSRTPLTQTLKGNKDLFELTGVRVHSL